MSKETKDMVETMEKAARAAAEVLSAAVGAGRRAWRQALDGDGEAGEASEAPIGEAEGGPGAADPPSAAPPVSSRAPRVRGILPRLFCADGLRWGYEHLDRAARDAYGPLLDCFSGYRERVLIPGADGEAVRRAFEAIQMDIPEVFWVEGVECQSGLAGTAVRPRYAYGLPEAVAILEEMESRTRDLVQVVRGMPSAERRVCAVHNAIIAGARYRDAEVRHLKTAAGPLVYREGLCLGFSRAVKYLLDRCDVPCLVATGTSTGSSGLEGDACPHAWNMVRIDGEWCHVDATFDLTASACPKSPRMDYLGVSDAEIESTHALDEGPWPACTRSLDYYGRKRLLVRSWKALEGLLALELGRGCNAVFQLDEALCDGLRAADPADQARLCSERIMEAAATAMTLMGSRGGSVAVSGNPVRRVYEVVVSR